MSSKYVISEDWDIIFWAFLMFILNISIIIFVIMYKYGADLPI